MIKRPIQRSVWVLLILNALVLGVVTLDWRADQVRQINGSVQGLAVDPAREIIVARPNQNLGLAVETAPAKSEPAVGGTFGVALSSLEAVDLQRGVSAECMVIGPFSKDERAKIGTLKLGIPAGRWETAGLVVKQAAQDAPAEYRVYAGPAESLNAAYELRKDFREEGLDSFVLTDGPLAKSVSLGVFSSFGAAERFIAAVPVPERAGLAIHSPGQSGVLSNLRLVGAETDWIIALQAAGLMAPAVLRKACPEPSAKF